MLLGWASKSLLLEAFDIDSIIKLFSAGVLLWRLRIEASGRADETCIEAVELRTSKLVGYTLYLLVVYVVFNSAYGIFVADGLNGYILAASAFIVAIFPKPILGVLVLFEGIALILLTRDLFGVKSELATAALVGLMAVGLPYGYLIGMIVGVLLVYLTHRGWTRLAS